MVKRVNPARMTFRLEFGRMEAGAKVNPNTGAKIKEFKPGFSVFAGQWSLRMTESLSLAGLGISNAVVFFIRHRDDITGDMLVRKDEIIYKINNISFDDGISPNGFDLITCTREVTKHG